MLTLVTPNLTIRRKSANALIKALREGDADCADFEIRKGNGDCAVSAMLTDASDYAVCIGGQIVRVIPRSEVIGTARLRVDAQRLRKTLAGAETMIIRPV